MKIRCMHINGYGCEAIVEQHFSLKIRVIKKERFNQLVEEELESYHYVNLQVEDRIGHHSGKLENVVIVRYPKETTAKRIQEIVEAIERVETNIRNAQIMAELVSITKGD